MIFSSIRDKFNVATDIIENIDTIDPSDDMDPGDLMASSGRSLTSSDEVWVVPMLVISAISVAIICIYQVGNFLIILDSINSIILLH